MPKMEIETIGEMLLLNELDDVVSVEYEEDCAYVKLENGTILKLEVVAESSFLSSDK